jgi:hypothetical protein
MSKYTTIQLCFPVLPFVPWRNLGASGGLSGLEPIEGTKIGPSCKSVKPDSVLTSFDFQEAHTILEFRSLKHVSQIKTSWAARVYSKLLTLAENYCGPRMFRLHCRYFKHRSVSFPFMSAMTNVWFFSR